VAHSGANSKTATVALAVGIAVVVALRFAPCGASGCTRWQRRTGHNGRGTFSVKVLYSMPPIGMPLRAEPGSETVLKEPINPIFGAGYGGFWLGERLDRFWAMYPTSPPIQAHNGYIEVYLNLGLIGLILIASVLLSGLRTIQRRAASSAIAGISNSTTNGHSRHLDWPLVSPISSTTSPRPRSRG
jgi:hypothetical protein